VRILGVDPSITSTGLAILEGTTPVWRYHWGIDGHNTDGTVRRNQNIRAVASHIGKVLATQQFDFASIEGRAHGARYGNPGEREALRQAIIGTLDVRKIPMAFVNPSTRALWVTGNGRAEKSEVLAAVRSWWPGKYIANDDEADAMVLALMLAMKLGEPMPFEVTQRHRGGLEKVEWPEVVSA
jgi:Holliday junction resolvasome RuvABC endonuclease subunit